MTGGPIRSISNGLIVTAGSMAGLALAPAVSRGWIHFPFLSAVLATLPFSTGWKLRCAIYGRILPQMGRRSVLHPGVVLEDPRTIIGEDVWISHYCYVDYAHIEDDVLIGPHAMILAGGRHHRTDRTDLPISRQGSNPKQPVVLGRGCWIGANATVMGSVGHDAIVGAGSVVTKPVAPFAVVAGNPARVLRIRESG